VNTSYVSAGLSSGKSSEEITIKQFMRIKAIDELNTSLLPLCKSLRNVAVRV
jgi:hypothetical protein